MPTLDTMAGKQKGKEGGEGKAPSKRPAKPKLAKGRKRSPAETDRPTEPEFDQADDEVRDGSDLPREKADRGSTRSDLTEKRRKLVEFYISDPERCGWKAAWRAGYSGGSEYAPYPEDKRKRQTLAQVASQTLADPAVQAYMAELDARATAVFLAGPQGAALLEHVESREVGLVEVEKLAAANLDQIIRLANFDPGDVFSLEDNQLSMVDWKELTLEQRQLIQSVKHVICPSCGFSPAGLEVKLESRRPYIEMIEKRVGKFAPIKHEVSGPGGGPISVEVEEAPDGEILDMCAHELLGIVPATVSEQERGLAADEVIAILRGWAADPEPHVGEVHQLFEGQHLEESMARYLGDDG